MVRRNVPPIVTARLHSLAEGEVFLLSILTPNGRGSSDMPSYLTSSLSNGSCITA